MPVPAKKSAPTPLAPPVNPDRSKLIADLAEALSELGGKYDDKKKEWIREPPPVGPAEGDTGVRMIRIPGVFSTRIATVDAATGRGGIPMSRITTITGGEAGGKTTMSLSTLAECQTMGGIGIYIDNEHKLDLDYAKVLGVDLRSMLLSQPGTIEDGLAFLYECIRRVHAADEDIPVFGVLDSINASKSEKEYEEDGFADMADTNTAGLAAQARVMSERLPKLCRLISNRKAAVALISQPRDNIGAPGQNLIAGGNAPKFYSALILHIQKKFQGGIVEEAGQKVGNWQVVTAIKNQVSKPYGVGEYINRWGVGIDFARAMIDRAVQLKLLQPGVQQRYEMEDPLPEAGKKPELLKWQGNKGWHKLATDRPDVADWMKTKIRESYGG